MVIFLTFDKLTFFTILMKFYDYYINTVGRQLSERVGTAGIRITEMFG